MSVIDKTYNKVYRNDIFFCCCGIFLQILCILYKCRKTSLKIVQNDENDVWENTEKSAFRNPIKEILNYKMQFRLNGY